MEPQASSVKTWQWVVTVIVIIALIVIGILVFGSSKVENPITDTVSPDQATPATLSLNRIVMSDQYPGNLVYLSSVQVENPSWIVIQKDKDGQPGTIIGSAHFDKGINPGNIKLSEPTIEGGTYYAVIYTDDASGKFNAVTDVPLKDTNGNIIMKVFHASVSADINLKG